MRRFSNFQALIFAFFLRDVYRDAARTWKGAGFLYALLLAAILTVLVLLRIQISLSGFARNQGQSFIDQLPTITVDSGLVSIDRPGPVIIRDRSGKEMAIIDTAATVGGLEGRTASALLTRTDLILRKSASETRIIDLAQIRHFVLTRERLSGWMRLAETFLTLLTTPFILGGIYVFRLVQMIFVALAALIVGSIRRVPLDFTAAMRLGVVAMTPATLVLDAFGTSGAHLPGSGWLWCAFTIGYVIFGVNACQADSAAPGIAEAPPAAP